MSSFVHASMVKVTMLRPTSLWLKKISAAAVYLFDTCRSSLLSLMHHKFTHKNDSFKIKRSCNKICYDLL